MKKLNTSLSIDINAVFFVPKWGNKTLSKQVDDGLTRLKGRRGRLLNYKCMEMEKLHILMGWRGRLLS